MAQSARRGQASLKSDLIAHLPQLRRFAVVLTGEADKGDALLGMVCGQLMAQEVARPPETPFDRWVLGRLYAHWLEQVRQRHQPVVTLQANETAFREPMAEWGPDRLEAGEIAAFLAALPPQQRVAVLLVYGEGYSYEEAAEVLDLTAQIVAARVAGTLGALVDRLDLMGAGRSDDARPPAPHMQAELASG